MATFLVGAIFVALLGGSIYLSLKDRRQNKANGGCGGGCAGCHNSACAAMHQNTQIR